ncbi:MAG: lytic transglycosylase domain-containing protein [Desulfuromonadales bacterium]
MNCSMRFLFEVLVVLFLGCTVLSSPVMADIYRHVDENGVVHFTNVPTGGGYSFYAGERQKSESQDLAQLVRHYSHKFNLEEALVHAVIKVESDYQPQIVSTKGAMGLMQLIPETARDMMVDNPLDIEQNVRGGCRYLRLMLTRFEENLDLALAAYNAGPTTVSKYRGIPPYKETRNYVKRVKHYLAKFRNSKDYHL